MNIFYLDKDIEKCVKYHCDKHILKMAIEYNQILSSAHWLNGTEAPYKLTHKNHPCCVWARQSLSNYKYLAQLAKKTCQEYTKRYGKIHKCESVADYLNKNLPNIEDKGFIEPPKCMPDEYKVDDTINSYRNFYRKDKIRFAKWKNGVPSWISENKS